MKQPDRILSPVGQEGTFTNALSDYFTSLGLESCVDAMGNVIAYRQGNEGAKTVMLTAPCDQIGCTVHAITEQGLLCVAALSPFDVTKFAYTQVKFPNGVQGVFVPKGGKVTDQLNISDFCVDIGASSAKEAKKRVKIGDCCAFATPTVALTRSRYAASADRAQVRLLCEVAEALVTTPYRLVFVCTVQSQLNARGAKVAAYAVDPDISITLAQTPQSATVSLGKGAVLRHRDRTGIADYALCDAIRAIANEKGIVLQEEAACDESGELAVIQASSHARSSVLCLPVRYASSPGAIYDRRDFAQAKQLLSTILESDFLNTLSTEHLN